MKLILTFILSISVQLIFACSCIGNETVLEAKKRSDVVVSGKVLSKKDITIKSKLHDDFDLNYLDYSILIDVIYKGKKLTDTLIIRTRYGGGDCGYEFEIGQKYLIYGVDEYRRNTRGGKNKKNSLNWIGLTKDNLEGIYWTDICMATKLLSEANKDILELK